MSGTTFSKLPVMIVALVIGLILTFSAVMPLVSDYSDDKTFTNKGRYYVDTVIEDDVTVTMDYDIDGTTRTWYINNEPLVYDIITGGAEYVNAPTVTGTDNYVFRADGRCRGLSNGTGGSDYTITVTNSTITNGTYVGNAPVFVASTTETDYIMRYSPAETMYILEDSNIYGCGYSNASYGDTLTTNLVITISGNIKDGVEITTYDAYDNTREFTVSDIVINANEINGYVDLYSFDSISFNVTYNDGNDDWVTACNYSMVVLPSEVTAAKDHPAAYKNLVSILPLFALILLVAGAASLVYFKNKD